MNLKSLLLQHKDCPVTKASKEGKLDHSILPPPIVCKFEYCETFCCGRAEKIAFHHLIFAYVMILCFNSLVILRALRRQIFTL